MNKSSQNKKMEDNLKNEQTTASSRVEVLRNRRRKQNMHTRGPGGRFSRQLSKPKNTKNTLIRLLSYLKNSKFKIFISTLFVLSVSVISFTTPILIKTGVDQFIKIGDFNGLIKIIVFLVILYLLSALFSFLSSITMIYVSQGAIKNIRTQLFEKIQTLSLSFYDRHKDGDIMSRLTNDVETISNTLRESVVQFITSVITIIGTLFMMFYYNWILASLILVTIPLLMIITGKIGNSARKYFMKQQQHLGAVNGIIEESVSGSKIILAYGEQDQFIDDLVNENNNLKQSFIKAQLYAGSLRPILNFFNNFRYIIITIVGAILVVNGNTSIGVIIAFTLYSRQFGMPLNNLAQLYANIQSALAGSERIFEVLDDDSEIKNSKNPIHLKHTKGEVKFKNVDFSYVKDVPILKSISLQANPGERIAFVGPTGAGKTTIINLLSRFYDIDNGEIILDDINIKDIDKNDLRMRIGIVLQDVYLFSGTIRDNIKYGKINATDEEIINAAKLSNAHDFIKHLPDGYDTILSKDGSNLSHGQRQLLSIARTILADPEILILDEATSNVDTRTEIKIQEAMLNLMKNRTSFIIAHRLSTIRDADKIIVINDGSIIEEGTHKELLDKKGFYFDLHNSQFETKILFQ